MVAFAAGQIIVVPFPFSDLSAQKYRPALILADAGREDWVLCQITSNPFSDPHAIELNQDAFSSGSLQRISYARPGKLFTASSSLFTAPAGVLQPAILQQVLDAVVAMLRADKD